MTSLPTADCSVFRCG